MKYLFLSLSLLLCITSVAQKADTTFMKSNEFGFGTAGFNTLFLSVKFGTQKGIFFKIQTEEIKWEQTKMDTQNVDTLLTNRSFGLRIGLEKRKWINKQLQFGIGTDLFWNRNMHLMERVLLNTNGQTMSSSLTGKKWESNWGVAIPIAAYFSLPNQRIHFWMEWAPNVAFSRDVIQRLDGNKTVLEEQKLNTFSMNLVTVNTLRFGAAFRFWRP